MSIATLKQNYLSENIAANLDEDKLVEIGRKCFDGYSIDESSRSAWLESMQGAIKIAKQISEYKNTPWEDASNVKFPLITTAIINFASSAYPEIIHGNKVALAGIIGDDPQGINEKIATRISDHLSYQLLVESPNWETDTDKLLMMLPLMGTVYRKSYFDPFLQIPATDLCQPDKVTVNNFIKNLDTARRVTHEIALYENDIIERQRLGIFRKIPLDALRNGTLNEYGMSTIPTHLKQDLTRTDPDAPIVFLEVHGYADLDGDGYEEPYIMTIHKATQVVMRITARYSLENIIMRQNKIIRIPPDNYFTDYHFIPNVDGSFHSIGYGTLLYPLNHTINTVINQVIDAQTLANRQCGFFGKGLRSTKGVLTFKPGEWRAMDLANGMDLKSNIMPLPVNQPSPIGFQLLSLMIATAKDLSNSTELMRGNERTQNSPATTVLAMLQQGLKTEKAILKRIRFSLTKEFEKLVRLNKNYLDDEMYYATFDAEGWIRKSDYDNQRLRVFPVADPTLSSDAERLARAQALFAMKDDPLFNGYEVRKNYLQALQVPNIDKVLPQPNPQAPPPPEVLHVMAETDFIKARTELAEAQAADLLLKRERDAIDLQLKDNSQQAQAAEAAARVQSMRDLNIRELAKLELEGAHMAIEQATEDAAALNTQDELPREQQIHLIPVEIPRGASLGQGEPQAPQNAPMPQENMDQGIPENMQENMNQEIPIEASGMGEVLQPPPQEIPPELMNQLNQDQ